MFAVGQEPISLDRVWGSDPSRRSPKSRRAAGQTALELPDGVVHSIQPASIAAGNAGRFGARAQGVRTNRP